MPRAIALLLLALALPGAATADTVVGRDARTALALTVYSGQDLAIVQETRTVALAVGAQGLRFDDVAPQIDPRTVAVTLPDGVHVLEQSFRWDLPTSQALLARWIGREVELVETDERLRTRVTPATLLSLDGPTLRLADRIAIAPPGSLRLPPVAGEEVFTRPTLRWRLDAAQAVNGPVQVSYATAGLGWSADYVAQLDAEETRADVTAWITLRNDGGTAFDDARVALVAGDVHRAAEPERAMFGMVARDMAMAAAPSAKVAETGFTEYHHYALERPTSVAPGETKQVELFVARGVGVAKRYETRGAAQWLRGPQRDQGRDVPVRVILDVANTKPNQLGRTMPAGVVRFYAPTAGGAPALVGEDRIGHTPDGKTLELEVGDAFDVTATRTQTDFRLLSQEPWQAESAYEVVLKNRRTTAVTVTVREPVMGQWEVLSSSLPAKKLDATTLAFDVPVAAGGETTLTWRLRVGG
ncbi:MAG: DUF4139 domain-containing protein [bacterium]|nr:DUF4139 domain-containing protein [bacterium]